jgi:hypothetical protein
MRSLDPPLELGISIGGLVGSRFAGGSSRRSRICPCPVESGGAFVIAGVSGISLLVAVPFPVVGAPAIRPSGVTGW